MHIKRESGAAPLWMSVYATTASSPVVAQWHYYSLPTDAQRIARWKARERHGYINLERVG